MLIGLKQNYKQTLHSFYLMAKILMYHGVDLFQNTSFNGRFISKDNLEKHLRFLKYNYNIITVEQAFEPEFINDNKSVCITFDDGYANNMDHVYPLVNKYNIPVAIYVTAVGNMDRPILWADLIDIATVQLHSPFQIYSQTFYKDEYGRFSELKKFIKQYPVSGTKNFRSLFSEIFSKIPDFMLDCNFDDYWKLLNNDQIKILSENKFITIGSHGYWHNNLANLDFEIAKNEIDQSLLYLEGLTGSPVKTLAFPDGSYNDALVNYCIERGVTQILGSHYELSTAFPKSALQHRIGIYAYDDVDSLSSKLNIPETSCVNQL